LRVAATTCVRLVVHGSVQGVGFRFAACDAASECSVTGWVRNLPDGSVEIVAQGSPDAVARMTAWARRGPRHASVDRVIVEKLAESTTMNAFEIQR
jgi:acylphosphatase